MSKNIFDILPGYRDNAVSTDTLLLQNPEREQRRIKSEMDKIMRLYLDDKISGDGFASEYRPFEERLNQLSDQIPELQGEIDFLKISFLSSDEIIFEEASLNTQWPKLDEVEKRNVIESITDR